MEQGRQSRQGQHSDIWSEWLVGCSWQTDKLYPSTLSKLADVIKEKLSVTSKKWKKMREVLKHGGSDMFWRVFRRITKTLHILT